MLVRLRSTSIALLGVVTAVGLALIVFISQIGFPGVFSSPIPGNRPEAGAVHDAIALTQPGQGGAAARLGSASPEISHRRVAVSARPRHKPPVLTDTGVGGSHQLAKPPEQPPNPAVPEPVASPEPAATPVPEPTGQTAPSSPPSSSESPPVSAVVAETPSKSGTETSGKQSSGAVSTSKTKSGGAASTKATSGSSSGKPKTSSAGKYGGRKSESPSNSAALPPAPPVKEVSEAPGYTTGKESADTGSSGKSRQ